MDYGESRSRYMARRLKAMMDFWGTDEVGLSRLIISRAEINLETIKAEYQAIFGDSLREDVKVWLWTDFLWKRIKPTSLYNYLFGQTDTNGDYESALVAIIDGNRPTTIQQ